MAEDPLFSEYFSDFATLAPESRKGLRFDNQLTQNYCCGVFVDNAALKRLVDDMASNPLVRGKMEDLFSHGRLEVFMAAANYALEQGLGLLEASEVLEPNPLDLNTSTCLSNLHNCNPSGALLYHQAAMEQIREIEAQEAETPQAETPEPAAPEEEPDKKPGFFSRLFGKK